MPTIQINHAGDGGLYGELIQDRSFDALAATSGFDQGDNWELTDNMMLSTGQPSGQPSAASHKECQDKNNTRFMNGVK